jgi:hypothetical protein
MCDVPLEVQGLGHVLHSGRAAVPGDADGEALGVTWVVSQPIEAFAFHGVAVATVDRADGEFEVDTQVATIEVAYLSERLIVEGAMRSAAHAAGCFFDGVAGR